jgi:hypothetical protein
MTSLTETNRPGEFILSEANGRLSRDTVTVTVATATILYPGMVLARLSGTGKYVPYDNAGSDGSETAYAILNAELDNEDGEAPLDFADAVVVNLNAEVRKDGLLWDAGVDASGKTAAYADLLGRGIKARD